MINKRKEITRMTELLESLRNELKVLERGTAQEVQDYMRQNSQYLFNVRYRQSRCWCSIGILDNVSVKEIASWGGQYPI